MELRNARNVQIWPPSFFQPPSFKPLLPPYGLLFASVGGGIVSTHTQTYEVIEVADKGSVSQKDSQGLLM